MLIATTVAWCKSSLKASLIASLMDTSPFSTFKAVRRATPLTMKASPFPKS